jgi:hypothetical protein
MLRKSVTRDTAGDVILVRRLDHESKAVHRLTVTAEDSSSSSSLSLTSTASLTVTVTDVNDNSPQISVVPNYASPESSADEFDNSDTLTVCLSLVNIVY